MKQIPTAVATLREKKPKKHEKSAYTQSQSKKFKHYSCTHYDDIQTRKLYENIKIYILFVDIVHQNCDI